MTASRDLLARLSREGPFGFGASSLGNLYEPMDDQQAIDAVHAAWRAGVRYFDTAPFYGFGLSEERLGLSLRDFPRDGFIVSTKVGRILVDDATAGDAHGFASASQRRPEFDYSYDGVMRSVEGSLERTGLDRFDIVLLHDVGRATHGAAHEERLRTALDGGMRALDDLRRQRVVTSIGLGVNEIEVCEEVLERATLDVILIAGRYTLLDQSAAALIARCHAAGIGIVAAGVFNSGILATRHGLSRSAFFDYAPAGPAIMRRVAEIERICASFNAPLAAAAQRLVSSHPGVTQSLLGFRDAAQISEALLNARCRVPTGLWGALAAEGLLDGSAWIPGDANA